MIIKEPSSVFVKP